MGVMLAGTVEGTFQMDVPPEPEDLQNFYEPDDEEAKVVRLPQWAKPFENFSSGSNVYIWMRLEFHNDYDLELCECGTEAPRWPRWVRHLEESFITTFIDYEVESNAEAPHPNVDWALKQGIAPGQPFLVEFRKPVVSGGGYDSYNGDYNDVDVEYPSSVVRVLPKSLESAAKAWTHALRRIDEGHKRQERLRTHYTRQGLSRKSAWKIKNTRSWIDSTDLRLIVENPGDAQHTLYHHLELAKGTDSSRDPNHPSDPRPKLQYRRAFDNLLKDFMQRYPDEDVSSVLVLSEAEYTYWDYLCLMEYRDE